MPCIINLNCPQRPKGLPAYLVLSTRWCDMNRKLLFRFTIPALAVGVLFFTACLLSVRYIHRLHTSLGNILDDSVISLQAAQELEIRVRQLRFHTLLYLLDPKPERLTPINEDQERFEVALEVAREASSTEEEMLLVWEIDEAYQKYKEEQEQLRVVALGKKNTLVDISRVSDSHNVRSVVYPCKELLRVSKDRMAQTAEESHRLSREGYVAMLILGIAGPIGGLAIGIGVTRGLRQSIYRLSVRVQNLAQHFERDIGSVSLVADGDVEAMEDQMKFIVHKVEDAARQLQEQQRELLRTEQLAQVGQLAAGLAHEVRNPLTGIKLLVEAALRPQLSRPLNREDTELILREVKRLEQTVQRFLNFARLPAPQTTRCDLRDLVHEAWEAVQFRARQQRVESSFQLPPSPVMVSVDPGQLTTVLVNLFLNGLDAVGQAGRLEIHLTPADQGAVRLRVCDSGPGISTEIQGRLFQPFASDKAHGTGLGLFLSGRILEEHGGALSASNRPEGGACFMITLPVAMEVDGEKNVAGDR
jgi:two-component system sensor histidine kinase HydH